MLLRIISGLLFFGLVQAHILSSCSESTPGLPICPPVDSMNETALFPNPYNCSTYFVCSNGCPIELNCPPGLNFDADLKTCVFPIDSKCTETPMEQLYPVDCLEGAVMPNPHDCGSFLYCLGGDFADIILCPPGTKFSHTLLVCDWTDNVKC